MHTREDVRPASEAERPRVLQGFGRTAMLASAALAGCVVLITLGTTISLCWAVHPLLCALATVVLVWCLARLAGRLVRGTGA